MNSFHIRCYAHGFGDSILLTVTESGVKSHALIDCGLLSGAKNSRARLDAVIEDIRIASGGQLDLLVITHEHFDHLSGFIGREEAWKKFSIGKVWMAWTENPRDGDANKLEGSRQRLMFALEGAKFGLTEEASALFAFSEGVREARDFVRDDLGDGLKAEGYLEPGQARPLIGEATATVLGPPRDPKALRVEDEKRLVERLRFLGATEAPASEAGAAESYAEYMRRHMGLPKESQDLPFAKEFLLVNPYERASSGGFKHEIVETYRREPWRMIGTSAAEDATELALQLTGVINNTSLALLVQWRGFTFLFPGDAQAGNWESWDDAWPGPGTISEALRMVDFYKIGHHGSHNGTYIKDRFDQLPEKETAMFMPFEPAKVWPSIPDLSLVAMFEERDAFVRGDETGKLLEKSQSVAQPADGIAGARLANNPKPGQAEMWVADHAHEATGRPLWVEFVYRAD